MSNPQLDEISALAEQQLDLENQVEAAESTVKDLKEKLRRISEVALPEAMASVDMLEFTLANGFKVKIKDGVTASIRAGMEVTAADWLEEQGLGHVVKDEVKINFGRGEDPQALLDFCQENNIPFAEKLSVHSSTLVALVKEQIAVGVEFPAECFSVYQWKKTEIKPPKGKNK